MLTLYMQTGVPSIFSTKFDHCPSCVDYLDPGLDVCFFNELDAYYGKTWLQIAYPLFIIVMVSCIILLSKTSL